MHDLDAHGAVGADAEENAARQEIGTTRPTARLTPHETQILESILDRKIKDTLDRRTPNAAVSGTAPTESADPSRITMADPNTTAFDIEQHGAPDDGGTSSIFPPDTAAPNVWTFPALSISLLLQSERRSW